MIQDGSTIADGETLSCDLCIIGAGAAGLALAAELERTEMEIFIIEAGGTTATRESQSVYFGDTISRLHPSPDMYRQRRLGGSSTIWGGRCVPLDPIDFERRAWVNLSGWPFGIETLLPYYHRAQQVLDAGEFDYNAKSALPDGELVEGFSSSEVLTDTIERFSLPTNLWAKNRKMLIASQHTKILYNSYVLRMQCSENGSHVNSAEIANSNFNRFRVKARKFVVAAGGLETYRILANSGSNRRGLGNQSDMLGRTYQCHLEMPQGELSLSPSERQVSFGFEITNDGVYARRRFTLSPQTQRQRAIMNSVLRLHHDSPVNPIHENGILSLMYLAKTFIIPEYRRKLSMVDHSLASMLPHNAVFWAKHLKNVLKGAPEVVAFLAKWAHRRHLSKRKLPYVLMYNSNGRYGIDMNLEQEPNLSSRLFLADATDRYGVPRIIIDWRKSEMDIKTIVDSYYVYSSSISRASVGSMQYEKDRIREFASDAVPVGGHHIGVARMSSNRREGVVDPDSRVYGLDNLYVAGAAVMPTSGQANPTLTIIALALKLADHIQRKED